MRNQMKRRFLRRNSLKSDTALSSQGTLASSCEYSSESSSSCEPSQPCTTMMEGESEFHHCIHVRDWYTFRSLLQELQHLAAAEPQKPIRKRGVFRHKKRNHSKQEEEEAEAPALLMIDERGRTVLNNALRGTGTPSDIVLNLLKLESDAAQVADDEGFLPLHLAVLHQHDMAVVEALLDVFPEAVLRPDEQGYTPLYLAVQQQTRSAQECAAPPPPSYNLWREAETQKEIQWQYEQEERWRLVNKLLQATHMLDATVVVHEGDRHDMPLLIQVLHLAAPPFTILNMLRNHPMLDCQTAASALFLAVEYHYTLVLLKVLVQLSPPQARLYRNEEGRGLVSAHFIAGCMKYNEERKTHLPTPLMSLIEQGIQAGGSFWSGSVPTRFAKWWEEHIFLTRYCSNLTDPEEPILHRAIVSNDCVPKVIRFLISMSPQSLGTTTKQGALPLHLACQNPCMFPGDTTGLDEAFVEFLLKMEPATAEILYQGLSPLQHAIRAGKSSHYLQILAQHYPEALVQRNPDTGLLPFQQQAAVEDPCGTTEALVAESTPGDTQDRLDDLEKVYVLLRQFPEAIAPNPNMPSPDSSMSSLPFVSSRLSL